MATGIGISFAFFLLGMGFVISFAWSPCRAEMPYIQELYEEYSQDENSDVIEQARSYSR